MVGAVSEAKHDGRGMSPRASPCSRLGRIAFVVVLAAAVTSSVWAASGDLLWETRAKIRDRNCPEPTALGELLFTHNTEANKNGRWVPVVRAYDLVSGKRVWESRGLLGFVPSGLPSIVAERGRVYSAAALPEGKVSGPGVAMLTARDAFAGAMLWRHRFEEKGEHNLVTGVAASGSRVFVVGEREPNVMVRAFGGASGRPLWSHFFKPSGTWATGHRIAVAKGLVIVTVNVLTKGGSGDNATEVRAYDATTGELRWLERTNLGAPADLTVHRNRVLTLGWQNAADRSFAIAHDLKTGRKLWQRRMRGIFGRSIDAARQKLAVYGAETSHFGEYRLQVHDVKTGEFLWRVVEDGVIGRRFVANRGTLFSTGYLESLGDYVLSSYSLASGQPRWSLRLSVPDETEEEACDVLVHRGILVATSGDRQHEIIRAYEP